MTFKEWVTRKELPVDENGDIKNCPFTRYKIGYWYCVKQFKFFKETKRLILNIEWMVLIQAIVVLALIPFLPVLIILSPIINPYFDLRNSKKRCLDDYKWCGGDRK